MNEKNTGLDIARDGRVLRLTINDPATRNSIGPALMEAARAAFDAAAADAGVGAVVPGDVLEASVAGLPPLTIKIGPAKA